MAEKISGVYQIQSKIKPKRIYIGSSVNVYKRWREHKDSLRLEKHHSLKLQHHYNKYGEKDLTFSVILGCEEKELIQHEQFFIDFYNPYFNAYKIVGEPPRMKQTEEIRKQRSEITKRYFNEHPEVGERLYEAQQEYFSNPNNRKRHSEIMKEYYKNNPQTEESIKKAIAGRMATMSKPDYIDPRKGRRHTKEQIESAIITRKKTMSDPNYVDPRKGVPCSAETIAKRKETWRKNKSNRKKGKRK